MKKLSLYVFLVLMFCNVGFAEEIVIYCTEQESTGYHTSSKPYKSSDFYLERFTAKVDFQNYLHYPRVCIAHFSKLMKLLNQSLALFLRIQR